MPATTHKHASHRQHMRSPPLTCTPTQHFTTHPPPAQPQTHHATATRYTHKHHALEDRQSRVPLHSRRDVLCSTRADGVPSKTMCASPWPPPNTNMHHTVNTRVHRLPPLRAHQYNPQPTTRLQTHHATATRYTLTPRTQGSSESCSDPQPSRCAVLHEGRWSCPQDYVCVTMAATT